MQSGTGSWFDVNIARPVQSMVDQLAASLPRLLGALGLFLVGWLIAKAIEQVVARGLKALYLDKLADQVQLTSVLTKGGIKQKPSELVGIVVYWLIMFAVVSVVFNALQLTVAADLFGRVVTYLPNVIAALFLLIIGMFVAAFVGSTVRTAASNAGIAQSHLLGQIVQTVVVVLAIVTALRQLEIKFISDASLIILGGISLGCAIAFGLGCKDLAGRWVSDIAEQVQGRKR